MAPRNDSDDRLITEKGSCRAPRFRLNECSKRALWVIFDRGSGLLPPGHFRFAPKADVRS